MGHVLNGIKSEEYIFKNIAYIFIHITILIPYAG